MDDYLPWLVLLNAPQLGSQRLRYLLGKFGTAENIIAASDMELRHAGVSTEAITSIRQEATAGIQYQLRWLQQPLHYILTINDRRYPQRLKHIPDPPVALFIDGDVDVLSLPQLAMVGSRNPTPGGRKTAHLFASQLAGTGLVITSGLASGIDYCAHEGALTSGQSIGVMGNGPDIIYPSRHRQLAGRIAGNGALVSEFPPGTPPLANHFPRRNRIISGLSLGVMVVEAATGSGSLITARCATEQGREVFAVPGPIQSPLSRGCHSLIKQGARLVETIVDVLEEVAGVQVLPVLEELREVNELHGEKTQQTDDEYRAIMRFLSHSPQTLDELIEMSGLTAETVSSMLLIMEVQGIVSSSGGQYTKIN